MFLTLGLTVAAFLASCSGGAGGGQQITVTINPTSTVVTVNQSMPFTDKITGTTNTAVEWEVNSVVGGTATTGTISASGVYTAPAQVPSPAKVTVTVLSQADATKSASAAVTIEAHTPNEAAQNLPIILGTTGGNANDSSAQQNLISCCGGTLGSLVERNGLFYILSNNHVLARSDSATLGDNIIQPGLVDSNCNPSSPSVVAHLSQFDRLETSGTNVDAAIALINPGAVDTSGTIISLGSTATGNVPDPGPPHAGTGMAANVGLSVAKSGRTTGLTCSTVAAIGITSRVQYQTGCGTGTMFTVTYQNQISVSGGTFGAPGDSGSLIVSQGSADPVALLFGGSDTDSVGNPVQDVLTAMADSLGNKPVFVGSAAHQVIACTLPGFSAATTTARSGLAFQAQSLASAAAARDLHANQLLANSYVRAVGVGASIDHPGEPAVLLLVDASQPRTKLPATLEGIRTRIVPSGTATPRGVLDEAQSARLAPNGDAFSVNSLSAEQVTQAKAVQAAHVDEWMKRPEVQGFGITSSADAPGEAAVAIFLIRGVAHDSVPPVIDGVRTRVRESSPFRAGFSDAPTERGCSIGSTRKRNPDLSRIRP
ncbi:MAG: hypothetical protein DMG51_01605 [Acidobacteria bacterium]|nr:MAG: hypothetical protein DMG51_01605 [Acidobacteriota bacterium]